MTNPRDILDVEELRIEFPHRFGAFVAVDNVALSVARGEIVGLVGESGAGKSTIGNAVVRLLEPPGTMTRGRIRFEGTDLALAPRSVVRRLRGRKIGMIFQDPMTALNPLFRIGDQLMETIQTHTNANEQQARVRAVDLLEAVGIAEPARRMRYYPHQLSGGMRQRVVISLALCGDPDLVIADEPTTALDATLRSQILQIIRDLCVARGMGVLLITHDLGSVARFADRIIVMNEGRVIEHGETRTLLRAPTEAYTKALIAAIPRLDTRLARFRVSDMHSPRDTDGARAASVWLRSRVRDDGFGRARPLLELDGVTKTFLAKGAILPRNRRYFTAVDHVSLRIARGETLGLVGESGSGKSTIGRMAIGLEKPTSGRILFGGIDLSGLQSRRDWLPVRSRMQIIFQDPYSSLSPRMKVKEGIMEAMLLHGQAGDERAARQLAAGLLERVGLSAGDAEKYPHQFSGGQRQRICIARALATRPTFLICDEPTSALDVSVQANVLNLLKDLRDELDLTMLLISHDLGVIRQMCDRIAVLKGGSLVEEGDNERVFTRPSTDYMRELLAATPNIDEYAALEPCASTRDVASLEEG
jgi:peptide/nickel transport system ATP-binding protein